ncbi:MAG TPA: DUF6176 family protein [Thermoplasmata archaeon]|nr:DUF6176 family protein [Thermoplasmata archaeon]
MALYAFVAPIQPNKTEEFRQFVKDLNGPRKDEYEASRVKAGFQRESMFLQNTPNGEMVVVIQEADSQKDALDSLRGMKDSFNVWFFQKLKDIHGIDLVGTDVPMNELLLDYRSDVATEEEA